MKKYIFLFILFPSICSSATTYKIREPEFLYDSTKGTFDNGSGKNRGALVGLTYTIDAIDNVNNVNCSDSNFKTYRPALTSYPTRNQLLNDIKQDATDNGVLLRLDKCLIEMKKRKDILTIRQEDVIPGVDGAVLP